MTNRVFFKVLTIPDFPLHGFGGAKAFVLTMNAYIRRLRNYNIKRLIPIIKNV